MFSIEEKNPVVIYHRSGRLMRPSDHMINGHGLGEVDGILDVMKNLGSGIVKMATAGMYDPQKNRFYVPFSSGQMRNWAQGITNTYTLGLVKTDKFFNSNTMKTIGTIAGGIAAAGTAYAVGGMAMSKFGGAGSSNVIAAPPGTTPVTLPSTSLLSTATKAVSTATKSLFSNVSMPSLDTVGKVLDIGSKTMGALTGGGGAPQQQQQQGGMPSQVVMVGGGGDPNLLPGGIPVGSTGLPMSYDPYTSYATPFGSGGGVVAPGGGGMMMMTGGGGGFGPPGSEFVQDQANQEVIASTGADIPTWLIVGGGVVVAYMLFSGKSKK